MRFLFLIVLLLANLPLRVSAEKCDNNAYKKNEKNLIGVSMTLKDAKKPCLALETVFKDWRPCVDRFDSEGYNDAIAQVASERWEAVDELVVIKKRDPDFYKFVLAALSSDAIEVGRWKKILDNLSKCPSSAKEICSDIKNASTSKTH